MFTLIYGLLELLLRKTEYRCSARRSWEARGHSPRPVFARAVGLSCRCVFVLVTKVSHHRIGQRGENDDPREGEGDVHRGAGAAARAHRPDNRAQHRQGESWMPRL